MRGRRREGKEEHEGGGEKEEEEGGGRGRRGEGEALPLSFHPSALSRTPHPHSPYIYTHTISRSLAVSCARSPSLACAQPRALSLTKTTSGLNTSTFTRKCKYMYTSWQVATGLPQATPTYARAPTQESQQSTRCHFLRACVRAFARAARDERGTRLLALAHWSTCGVAHKTHGQGTPGRGALARVSPPPFSAARLRPASPPARLPRRAPTRWDPRACWRRTPLRSRLCSASDTPPGQARHALSRSLDRSKQAVGGAARTEFVD